MTKYVIIHIFFCLVLSCSQEQSVKNEVPDVKNAFVLKKQIVSKILNLPAEVLPYERAEIYAKVEGYVKEVNVDIGERVSKGSVIVTLDAPEVIAQYAEASARQYEAEARFNASKDKFMRIQSAAKHQGVVAETEQISSQNQMLADSAALASARAAMQAYKQLSDYLSIRAPFDGVITQRNIDPGDFISNSSNSHILTVERLDKFRVRIYIPESYVNSIPSESELTLTTDAVANKAFTARLARKSGRIDPDTRTELWEYEYANTGNEMKSGMYAMASIQLNRPDGSFVVPFPAVATTLERKFVVRVNQDKIEWIDVREGISQENGVEIFGELNEGDTLLFRGSDEIKSGTYVSLNIQNL